MRFEVNLYFTTDSSEVNSAVLIADVEAKDHTEAQDIADGIADLIAQSAEWSSGPVIICERAAQYQSNGEVNDYTT